MIGRETETVRNRPKETKRKSEKMSIQEVKAERKRERRMGRQGE